MNNIKIKLLIILIEIIVIILLLKYIFTIVLEYFNNKVTSITNILYINLEHRKDRKDHVLSELGKVFKNIEPIRFNAIKKDDGHIGCTLSHIECLEIAIKNNWSHVLIVEDDITFLKPEVFADSLNSFFNSDIDWDVLILGGNNSLPYNDVNDYCIKITNCQTTTGYLVKQKYYNTLLNNFKEGLDILIKRPPTGDQHADHIHHQKYNIDMYWKNLQRVDNWYMLKPFTVIQKPNYSDISSFDSDNTSLFINGN